MTSLPRDANRITVIGGVSSSDNLTPTAPYVDPTTHRLYVNLNAGSLPWSGLTNPSANLALSMGAYTTAFSWTGGGQFNLDSNGDLGIGGATTSGASVTINPTTQSGTKAWGLYVNAPTGATNNYAASFMGGNVGIGTTSPATSLDINGNITVRGGNINNPSGTINLQEFGATGLQVSSQGIILPSSGGIALNGNHTAWNTTIVSFIPVMTGTLNSGYFNTIENIAPSASSLINNGTFIGLNVDMSALSGTSYAALFNGGNVGIGTMSPGSKLVIQGTDSTSSNSALNVTNSGAASLLYVRDDGNVGIGTTSPGSLLDVNGATTATSSNNYSSGAINLTGNYWNGSASASDYWSLQNVLGTGTNPTSTLTFLHSGSSGAAAVSIPTLTLTNALTVANGGTGLATLTANNVILGNGTSNPTFVAPGTSGNVLTSNGTTWTSAAPRGGSALASANSYVTNTTYTLTTIHTWTDVDATNLKLTMTTGAHRVMLTFTGTIYFDSNSTSGAYDFTVDGTRVASTNTLGLAYITGTGTNIPTLLNLSIITDVLTAGSHTFKLQWYLVSGAGTLTLNGATTENGARFTAVELYA